MPDESKQILNYAAPVNKHSLTRRRLAIAAIGVGGGIAGHLLVYYLMGWTVSLVALGGVSLGLGLGSAYICPNAEFRATVFTNLIAFCVFDVITFFRIAAFSQGISVSLSRQFVIVSSYLIPLFLLPGLFGALWIWEGRKPSSFDTKG